MDPIPVGIHRDSPGHIGILESAFLPLEIMIIENVAIRN
jgi:hypothetical protein